MNNKHRLYAYMHQSCTVYSGKHLIRKWTAVETTWATIAAYTL